MWYEILPSLGLVWGFLMLQGVAHRAIVWIGLNGKVNEYNKCVTKLKQNKKLEPPQMQPSRLAGELTGNR